MTTPNYLEKTYYVGEVGETVPMSVGVDLSAALAGELKLQVKKPGGAAMVRTVPTSDVVAGTDGAVNVTLAAGDFDRPGDYWMQLFFDDASESTVMASDIYKVTVKNPLLP